MLRNVASDSEAIAVVGPTRKARRIKPSVSVVFFHSDHLLDTRSGESQASCCREGQPRNRREGRKAAAGD